MDYEEDEEEKGGGTWRWTKEIYSNVFKRVLHELIIRKYAAADINFAESESLMALTQKIVV